MFVFRMVKVMLSEIVGGNFFIFIRLVRNIFELMKISSIVRVCFRYLKW